jgi:signal transduction histidine kinase
VVARLSPSAAGRPTRGQAVTIALTGAAATGFAAVMIGTGLAGYHDTVWAVGLTGPIGLAFIAAGLIAWWRWPTNRVGLLLVLGGGCWYLTMLQDFGNPVLYAIGYWLTYLDLVVLTHAALAYPEGRLTRRIDRQVVIADYVVYLTLQGVRYVVDGRQGPIGPRSSAVATVLGDVAGVYALVFSVIVCWLLLRRWLAASPPVRRVHGPVWLGVVLSGVILLAGSLSSMFGAPQAVQVVMMVTYVLCLFALPLAFLSGLVRVRLARLRVADLVVELSRATDPERLRDRLSWALRDPTLVVGYWSADAADYVDARGRPVAVTGLPADRTATVVDRGARRLAVLVHDAALADQPALIHTAVAAVRLALENAHLQARVVQAALDERRKIERNLHDGVQQRLLRLTWLAKQAQTVAATETTARGVVPFLDQLAEEARGTFAELRELAQGIHPSLGTEKGLAVAVEEYALRAPVAVLVDLPPDRLPPAVEVTAYFVISEAVVNAIKHAGVDEVRVSGRVRAGRLVVEVSDDGSGGANPAAGTGLLGLSDRVAALGGILTVRSVPGHGTRVVAELPCG